MSLLLWIGFLALVFAMLAVDLGVARRRTHELRAREALAWTAVCIALALAFNVGVYFLYSRHWLGFGLSDDGGVLLGGREAAVQFFTGWLVEYSLSVDNIFVIAMLFTYFRVPRDHQHRVLVWGVIGALLMRGAMIGAGTTLIDMAHSVVYVFAAILLYSAARLLLTGDTPVDPEKSAVLRLARRWLPVSPAFVGDRFFTRIDGRRVATPLLLVLLVVETTDVIFAVDSIPAIIGITQEPFLVFTSNIFAILGLRSLYFVLASAIENFRFLKLALVVVLMFVGVKLLLGGTRLEISTEVSLAVIGTLLGAGVIASILWRKN